MVDMEIVATTTPSIQVSRKGEDPTAELPYEHIVALWHNDGSFGRHLGVTHPTNASRRTLRLPGYAGERLFSAFEAFLDGDIINCHKFGRMMLGMEVSLDEPVLDFNGLEPTNFLEIGRAGIVGVSNWGVPHTLGYGMGDEALQVMSSFGELGIARNTDVLNFYTKLYPDHDVKVFQIIET